MAGSRTTKMAAARKAPASHAGPKGSFPVFDAKSARAAYSLAGHAANPGAVRARVKKIAKAKGLGWALPATAKGK